MSSASSGNLFSDLSDEYPPVEALVDRLFLGFSAALPVVGRPGWIRFRTALAERGMLVRPRSEVPRYSETIEVAHSVEVPRACGGSISLTARFDAAFGYDDRPVLLRPWKDEKKGSVIRLNLMNALASSMNPEHGRFLGLDGNTNVGGAVAAMTPDVYDRQLDMLVAALNTFFASLHEAAGSEIDGDISVVQMEVCRDLAVKDAIGVVGGLRDVVLAGAGKANVSLERPHKNSGLREPYHVLTWKEDRAKSMLRAKLYPKTQTLVRAEIVFDGRDSIRREVKATGERAGWAGLEGAWVAQQVDRVVVSALPSLFEVVDLVDAGRRPQASHIVFMVMLTPLLRILNPQPGKRGAKVSAETRVQAEEAIRSLIRAGTYKMTGLPKGVVKDALKEMSDSPDGGLFLGGSQGSVLTVRPEYEGARKAFRAALFS